jgi:hypothetical protein
MSCTSCDCEDCLSDLLCDLMHWADKCGVGFEGELYRARCNYAAGTAKRDAARAPATPRGVDNEQPISLPVCTGSG